MNIRVFVVYIVRIQTFISVFDCSTDRNLFSFFRLTTHVSCHSIVGGKILLKNSLGIIDVLLKIKLFKISAEKISKRKKSNKKKKKRRNTIHKSSIFCFVIYLRRIP